MKNKLCLCLMIALAAMMSPATEWRWVKGNTHAHTSNSDGNETPRRVARWYQDYGYQFLFITDHDMITETAYLDANKNADDFILIPGEEITLYFHKRPAHVNALNPTRLATAVPGQTMVATLQNGIDAALAVGAIVQLNHPNWKWSWGFEEASQLRGMRLFELLNVNRDNNNFSAGGRPGTEELWDKLLSAGMLLYGVASDDTHDLLGEFLPERAHPGKGWVCARVAELTPEAVCAALAKGDFYASTGVELADVRISEREYRVTIKPYKDTACTVFFIGKDGTVLKKVDGLDAAYPISGDELYVRAKVVASNNELAFCQPVFIKK